MFAFLLVIDIEIAQAMEADNQVRIILYVKPGDARSQAPSIHGIDLILKNNLTSAAERLILFLVTVPHY